MSAADQNSRIQTQSQNYLSPYRKQTISKYVAIAMLLTTLVAAALAIYFGYQAWHAGVDPGSFSKLMESIPFKVTFLTGCSTAMIGMVTAIYSLYKHYYKEEDPIYDSLPASALIPSQAGLNPEPKLTTEDYHTKACELSVAMNKNGHIWDTKRDPQKWQDFPKEAVLVKELVDNYELMLEESVFVKMPHPSLTMIVRVIYARGMGPTFCNKVEELMETGKFSQRAANTLRILVGILREEERDRLIQAINSSGDIPLRDRLNRYLWAALVSALNAEKVALNANENGLDAFSSTIRGLSHYFSNDDAKQQEIVFSIVNMNHGEFSVVTQIEAIDAKTGFLPFAL